MKADHNRRIGLLLIGLWACLQSGCAMCSSDFDCFYGAYGGSVCRDDMVCGRLNSVIRPARGYGGGCEDGYCDDGHCCGGYHDERGYPVDAVYEDQPYSGDYIPYDGDVGYGSGQPYELGPVEVVPSQPMNVEPGQVEAMNYEEADEDDYGAEYEAYGSELGYDEEPVEVYEPEVFEPEYGYDDPGMDSESQSTGFRDEPIASSYSDQPIGSGVRRNTLRGGDRRVPRTTGLPMSTMPGSSPTDEFIDRLVPLSKAPAPGFLQRTPRGF